MTNLTDAGRDRSVVLSSQVCVEGEAAPPSPRSSFVRFFQGSPTVRENVVTVFGAKFLATLDPLEVTLKGKDVTTTTGPESGGVEAPAGDERDEVPPEVVNEDVSKPEAEWTGSVFPFLLSLHSMRNRPLAL